MPTLGWRRAYRSGDLVRLETRRPVSSAAAPTTRSRSAAGASSWARSTRRWCTCRESAAARPRCAGPPAAPRCWSATSPAPTRTSTSAAARATLAEQLARRAGAAAGPRRRAAHPHVGQGRPRRAALAAAGWPMPSDDARSQRHDGLAGRAVARRARRATVDGPGGRLLRARRRLAGRGAAGGRAARALSAGDRRRPLRPSRGWARWPAFSTSSTRRRRSIDAGGATDAACWRRLAQVVLSVPLATLTGAAVGDLAGAGQQCRPAVAPGRRGPSR